MASENSANGRTSGLLRQAALARTSRRAMLRRGGLMAAVTVAGVSLLDQHLAEAATAGDFMLGEANDANITTSLSVTAADAGSTLIPLFLLDGTGLSSTSTTLIVNGPTGAKSTAALIQNSAGGVGLEVTSASTAHAVGQAISASGTGSAGGVKGTSGSGAGVAGSSGSGTGIAGASNSGDGVTGSGTRGGVFTGRDSQVRLTPSTGFHPRSGSAGDLFVDKDHHLWFCKGSTTWVKLA
jgi:hypothetical protein